MTAPVTPASIAIFSHGEIIGDALYKVPFVRAVRGAFPQARLAWVTTLPSMLESRLGPLMAGFVDEFRTGCGLGTSPLELLRPCPIREHYDIVIDTQSVVWRTLLARRIRHGVFVSPAAGFRLSERRPPPGYVKPPHMVDRLLDLMELAGGVRPARLPRLTIPADLAAVAARQLPDGRDYIALAPGAGKRVKCWPLDRFVAVARAQAERGRVPLFVLGPDEQEWLPELRAAVPEARFPEQEAEFWGDAFSPLKTIAIAARCAAGLANDSGLSHMFGAADLRLLTLYGPSNAEKFRPKVTRGAILTAQGFGGEAMDAIPVAPVVEALEGLLRD